MAHSAGDDGGLAKVEARLRRVNDVELVVLARALGCGVQDLYPKRVMGLGNVLRQGRG